MPRKSAKDPPAKPSKVKSSGLAVLMGLNPRQIRNLAKEGMPHDGEWFVPGDCVQWYVRYKAKAEKPTSEADARARKMTADAQLAELTLAERRGELVETRVHEERVEQISARLFAVITAELPRQIRQAFPDLPPLRARDVGEQISDALVDACHAAARQESEIDESDGPADAT